MSELISPVSGVAFAFLGAAYAALCIWLIVQIVKGRQRRAKWTAAGLVVLPMLYVLSSGPMVAVAFRDSIAHMPAPALGQNAVAATSVRDPGPWWPQLYAPLVWASDHSWGESLFSYWELFPVQQTSEPQ